MSRKFVIALVCSFAISGFCTLFLGRKMSSRSAHRESMVHYAAAKKAIDAGEIIRPEELVLTDWPASRPVDGAFAKLEDVAGRSAVYPIGSGQVIVEKYLAAPGAGIGLTTRIKDGMRAVALKSDDVVGVAGFLFPGSHVDVLVTYHPAQSPDPVTSTVVQDAQVVAVGHQIHPDPDGKPSSVNVVTVLVQPLDAERLVLASTQGSVYFVMRNGGDHDEAVGGSVRLSELGHNDKPDRSTVHPRSVRHQPTETYIVETIQGDKRSSVKFQ